jgi:hypothetical protein
MFFVLSLHKKGPGHRERAQGGFNLQHARSEAIVLYYTREKSFFGSQWGTGGWWCRPILDFLTFSIGKIL